MMRKHRLFRNQALLAFGMIFLFLSGLPFITGCSSAYNPVTGKFDRTVYDRDDEIKAGKQSYPRLLQISNGALEDSSLQSYVSRVGQRIAQVSHDPFFNYEFTVVNDSAPNAWALPGGKIGVTRGLLMKMSSEGQLAAVLGHEITHVTARHSAKQQTQALTTNLILVTGAIALQQATGGEESGTVEQLLMYGGMLGAQLYLTSYSRDHEREADEHGIWYMARAGYDPEGMVELHKLFRDMRDRKPSAVEVWFSTHPAPSSRVSNARNRVQTVRSQVDIPKNHRVQGFQEHVVNGLQKRKEAYDHMDQGVKALQNNRYDKAASKFRRAINEYEDESLFHSWLAITRIKQDQRPDAYRSIGRALQMRPELFHTRMSAGRVYMEGKDHRKSIEHFKKAKQIIEVVPVIDFFLGRNYEKLGNRSKAIEHYRIFLEQGGRGEKAKYARQRLKEWGVIQEESKQTSEENSSDQQS